MTRTIELTKDEAYDVISGLSHVLAEAQRLEKMAFTRDLPAREKRVADVRELADRFQELYISFDAQLATIPTRNDDGRHACPDCGRTMELVEVRHGVSNIVCRTAGCISCGKLIEGE